MRIRDTFYITYDCKHPEKLSDIKVHGLTTEGYVFNNIPGNAMPEIFWYKIPRPSNKYKAFMLEDCSAEIGAVINYVPDSSELLDVLDDSESCETSHAPDEKDLEEIIRVPDRSSEENRSIISLSIFILLLLSVVFLLLT